MSSSPDARPTVTISSPGDVIAVVNSGRLVPRRPRLMLAVALGSIFVDGWDLGSFGLGAQQIRQDFGLDSGNWGLDSLPFVSASVLVGALIGGLVGGWLTDRVGRYRMMILDLVLLVFAAAAAGLAPNVESFVAFRFLMGIGVGLDVPVALAFIAEVSALSTKGRNVNFAQVMSTGASAVVFAVALGIHALGVEQGLWRWAIGLGAVPALIVLSLRYFASVESPMWVARHGSVGESVEILRKTYVLDEVRLVVTDDAERAPKPQATRPGDVIALFRSPFGRRTLLVSVLVVTQAVEFYAISLYTPTILTQLFGANHLSAVLAVSAAVNVVGAIGAYACTRVVQRTGIRVLAMIGFVGTATALALIAGLYGFLASGVAAALIAAFYFLHNLGPGYAGTAMGTLSYPTAVRGTAGGYTQAVTRVGGIVGAYAFPVLTAASGQRVTIAAIVVAPTVALVALLLIRWDPIGQDVDADAVSVHAGVGT
jgi:MFS family permease